jgi:hypothetical protein
MQEFYSLEFTMPVGVNLVFYNNSPSGKQRNLRTSRQNSEALVITMAIFTKSVIGLKSAKIQKGPTLGRKISTD